MTFDQFFTTATCDSARPQGASPYDYQCRLACGEKLAAESREAWLGRGTICASKLIEIPTGLGKTAAVTLAWLWNRVLQPNTDARAQWPRRLVYCLPMRTLVEQTAGEARKWANNLLETADELGLSPSGKQSLAWLAEHSPIILMGGEDTGDWDIHPERDAILIGTQDMLLSRALNRGYASSRAHWPVDFGLLNQDCLWILDEVQLMDVGLATSAQLQAFRRDDLRAAKQLRPCVTWWMSATLQPEWFESADTRPMVAELKEVAQRIPEDERSAPPWKVSKPCSPFPVKDTTGWARKVWETHLTSVAGEYGRITLVIANTVRTARELYAALEALSKRAKSNSVELRLIHSRFRGMERKDWREQFLRRGACNPQADRIIVATQVIEAGVDISATTLFTELAPWPSLVQRFGRAARYGGSAQIFVVDRNPSEKAALPYELSELDAAREALPFLPDASLAGLAAFKQTHAELIPRLFPYSPKHLLLRRELEELVDTTPDLSGADLDISRFIRSGEERDVLVFWREVESHSLPEGTVKAMREELCAVSIGDARTWLANDGVKTKAWVWDYVDGLWRSCRKDDIYPGQTILVSHSAGGYDVMRGWTGGAGDRDFPLSAMEIPKTDRRDADADEQSEATSQRAWESIAVHGAHVGAIIAEIGTALGLPEDIAAVLDIGSRWHDVGKGHPAFQGCIKPDASGHPRSTDIAKAPPDAWWPKRHLYKMNAEEQRRGFRHELATAIALFSVLQRHAPQHPALLGPHFDLLAALGQMPIKIAPALAPTGAEQDILDLDQPSFDLLAYLTCAHHGKVRGAWHASPADQEYRARDDRGLPIHGVREGDTIPPLAVTAADETAQVIPEVTLHLEPARIGLSPCTGASWSERVAGLLAAHGPFALTYMEALLRAADIRASRTSATAPENS